MGLCLDWPGKLVACTNAGKTAIGEPSTKYVIETARFCALAQHT